MLEPWAIDDLLIVAYRPYSGATELKIEKLHSVFTAHPERFLLSTKASFLSLYRLLTHPDNMVWEVWRNGEFLGIIVLDRIVAGIDARLQFVFFDDELGSKEPLLQAFIARCYADFGLVRLTTEVPECMSNLIGFVRRKLGFRYEGELQAPASVARRGSRRERAYWDGTRWHDVMVLRHLAEGV